MATTQRTARTDGDHDDRANPLGAFIVTLGALILLISIFLDWLTTGRGDDGTRAFSGYEGDGVIPFFAYLAVGFALALLYATKRADRRQHRGLSLASFAVGLATLAWVVSFLLDPISTAQYNENISTEIGPWIAALGALLWTVGSFLLAKEPEGDREHVNVMNTATRTTGTTRTHEVDPSHRSTHTEVHPVDTHHTDTHRTETHRDVDTGRTGYTSGGTTDANLGDRDRDFGDGSTRR